MVNHLWLKYNKMKWIKIVILFCTISIIGCRKVDIPTPQQPISKNIFDKTEVSVINGQDIQFTLQITGKYTFTLTDSINQIVSRERFTGVSGENVRKIYTKSFTQKSLNLYLSDENNNQINKTRIIIN